MRQENCLNKGQLWPLPTSIMSSPSGNGHQLLRKGDAQAADLICTASCIAGPAAVAATKDALRM